ncbi:Amino acid transporter, putative [Hondaea fermentalgiana]|uniref:Amino acid transporter, putative n=1 Tax=Hondaea fermentalgiana TaxID=2315210 RepID=A0A2R5GEP5_9STRA|nr:Amino acid transporter, putative [Hondaea fermentalgiana]|eukprot:GBG29406.1 Amino acid transporter, putative [Hondaea fermentalgiana]
MRDAERAASERLFLPRDQAGTPRRNQSYSAFARGFSRGDYVDGVDDERYDLDEDDGEVAYATLVQDELERTAPVHESEGTSSVCRVTFNFINTVVGSGVLAIPFAIQQAGFAFGLLMAAFVGSTSDYTIRMLVNTGLREGVRNYEELMDKLFGFGGWAIISTLLFMYDAGAMQSYLIILGHVSGDVIYEVTTDLLGLQAEIWQDRALMRRVSIVVISLTLILPLCLMRDVSRLEHASAFSVVTVMLVILVVVGAAVAGDNCPLRHTDPSTCPDTDAPWFTLIGENPSAAYGILAFAFVSHDTSFLFYNSLRNASQARWKKVSRLALGGSIVICLTLAIPGYISFRETVKQNILDNFAPNDLKIVIVRVLFMITMSFTYPICFFICRHILNEMIYRWKNRDKERVPGTPAGISIKDISQRRHLTLTFVLFTASILIALAVDDLGLVMAVTGNISAVSISFVLPPLCAMRSRWEENISACRCIEAERGRALSDPTPSVPLLPASGGICPRCYPENVGYDASFIEYIAVLTFGCFTLVFCTLQTLGIM